MKDDMMDKVVHNLTHRRFKGTSKQSIYELGSSVANSFFNPRNVGNFEAGEIAPEGHYLTHYPVNCGSNTAGFSIMDDEGDDRRYYYPSQVYGNSNALLKKSGGSSGSSSGSASDYVYFNPSYEALLNPKSNTEMMELAQPHFIPRNTLDKRGIEGRGTNAPSSGSSIDYDRNNPYAFKSKFGGGALGASSSGSASDYFDSDPFRTPAIQSETRHYTEFMKTGGEIDWSKYLGYIRKGIETAPKIYEGIKKGQEVAKQTRQLVEGFDGKKNKMEQVKHIAKHVPKIYEGSKATLDTIQELRKIIQSDKGKKKRYIK